MLTLCDTPKGPDKVQKHLNTCSLMSVYLNLENELGKVYKLKDYPLVFLQIAPSMKLHERTHLINPTSYDEQSTTVSLVCICAYSSLQYFQSWREGHFSLNKKCTLRKEVTIHRCVHRTMLVCLFIIISFGNIFLYFILTVQE